MIQSEIFNRYAIERVALGAGARDRAAVARSATATLLVALGAGATFLVVLLVVRQPLARLFLDEGAPALAIATTFLLVLALMQPVEAVATAAAGALRGLCDTRVPMLVLLLGHWGAGFVAGLVLAFWLGLGGLGIWIGLGVGSSVVAVALAMRLWRKAVRQ